MCSVLSLDEDGFTTEILHWGYFVYEEPWVICNFYNIIAITYQWELFDMFSNSVVNIDTGFFSAHWDVCLSQRFSELTVGVNNILGF